MKNQKYLLQIPEPCNQDWNKMTPQDQGRYCEQCTKVVLDFSNFTDEQIVAYLQNNKGEVCGRKRMRRQQLNKEYTFVYKSSHNFNSSLLRYSLAGLLTFTALKSVGQNQQYKAGTTVLKDNSGKHTTGKNTLQVNNGKEKKLTVKVTDKFTGKALANALVTIEGVDGIYKPASASTFIIDVSKLDENKVYTVYVSCVGKETQMITVDLKTQGNKPLLVSLDELEMIMGKMIYVPQNDSTNSKKCTK
jgi:hypothetical protein